VLLLQWGQTMTLWNWTSNGPFVHPPDNIWVNMEQRWNDDGKAERLGVKPVPVPPCPPQIPHGLTCERTRASSVRIRQLTAWAMTRPYTVVRFSGIWSFIRGSLSLVDKNISRGVWEVCWGEYCRCKWEEGIGDCIMRSVIIFTLHQMF
jgi:hypothetical protein